MPPLTETTPTASRHFKITRFDPAQVRKLVRDYREVTTEISETEELHEQLKAEVAKLQKSTKFTDKKQLEILSMKRLQLEMCPNKLSELQEQQTALQNEMRDVVKAGKHGLCAAVRMLASHESKRIETELVSGLQPVLGSEKESREVALNSQRYVNFQNRHTGWTYKSDLAEAIETALEFLDLYDRTGTLETAQ